MPRYFHAWRASGLWQRINGILRLAGGAQGQPRCRRDRQPKRQNPRAAKPRKAGEICGDDAGKKVKGRKRHILTDTCEKLKGARAATGDRTIEIIKRSDTAKGFDLLPRRWAASERSPG